MEVFGSVASVSFASEGVLPAETELPSVEIDTEGDTSLETERAQLEELFKH